MQRIADRILLASAVGGLLLIGAIRAFISSVYFQNLSSLGLNSTALFALLFLSPVVLLAPKIPARATLLGAALALALSRVAMNIFWGSTSYLLLGAVAVASGMIMLTLLAHQGRIARGTTGLRDVAFGLGLAFALDAALTYFGVSTDPSQRLAGIVVTIPAGIALVYALLTPWPAPRAWTAVAERKGALLAGAGIGAWIFLEHSVFASPHAMARWNDLPFAPLAFAMVLGAAIPSMLALIGRGPDWRWLTLLNTVLLVAVIDHTFVHSSLLPIWVLGAQAALVFDLWMLLRPASGGAVGHVALAFVIAGLVTLLLHFIAAFALNFGFVPLSGLWEGNENWLVPVAFLLVSLPALAIARREGIECGDVFSRATTLPLFGMAVALIVVGALAPSAAIPEPNADLRVMTLNVHQGFDNDGVIDADIFERILREENPDIVVLQESDTPRVTSANIDIVAVLVNRLGYHAAYGPPTSEESFGVSVLSRFPIQSHETIQLASKKDHRFVVEARLDVRGQNVTVYAVHLGLPANERQDQIAHILARVANQTGPVILAGDLNSCPFVICPDAEGGNDTVYQEVVARLNDTVATPQDPAYWTYEATNLTQRIDYVFANGVFNVIETRVIRSEAALAASDHLPVVATLRVG